MKVLIALIACFQLLAAGPALAKPLRTKFWDAVGTRFLVSVDWEARLVVARLKANPADLSEAALEHSMQLAVYYGSAAGCQMRKSDRRQNGPDETVGLLDCPWFE